MAYYMPRNPKTMPLCAPEKVHCVEHALTTVEETAFSDHGNLRSHVAGSKDHGSTSVSSCKCLPSCTNVEFPHETSTSSLRMAKFVNIPTKLKRESSKSFVNKEREIKN